MHFPDDEPRWQNFGLRPKELEVVSGWREFGLTLRELEVASGVVADYSFAEIAKRLGLKEDVVKNYWSRVFQKLRASRHVEPWEKFGPVGPGGSGNSPEGAEDAAGFAVIKPKGPQSDKEDPPVWKTKQTGS